MTEGDSPDGEMALFIDPCRDDPEEALTYDWGKDEFVWILERQNNSRGRVTWTELGLNRTELLEQRGAIVGTLQLIVQKMNAGLYLGNNAIVADAEKLIREETSHERQFAGFRRDFFRKAGLGAFVNDD